MALTTAASASWCALFFLFFCVSLVFCESSRIVFSREDILNLRESTPSDLFPTFLAPSADLMHLLLGAVALGRAAKRRRGKRSGALNRFRQRGLKTLLPAIFLSNVRSLCNKVDELLLMVSTNRDFSLSSVLCFTESWLCGTIPDSALQLPGFQLFRADRDPELSHKTKGGGICFYINDGWCKDVTVLQRTCSPDLESFIINSKPFYSPREFSSFILVGVYIPPQAHVELAQRLLADQIREVERKNPDSLVIVLGDFNKGNLSQELPKYKQFIKCPTREENTLDKCYCNIRDAYHTVPRAALGNSDHVLVHLIPSYRQRVKLALSSSVLNLKP